MNAGATFSFVAADSWFFRDGRPFNMGDPAQVAVSSLFPPYPPTVVGALRVVLARLLGWNGQGDWSGSTEIASIVGLHESLGALKVAGVFASNDGRVLFPAPHLLAGLQPDETAGRTKWTSIVRLSPSSVPFHCDLGRVHLPVLQKGVPEGMKPLHGCWLTESGLKKVLDDGVPDPDDVFDRESLAASEGRVGIHIDPKTGSVEKGHLYATRFVRPHSNVALCVPVAGLGERLIDAASRASLVPFGGEGRMAWVQGKREGFSWPASPVLTPDVDRKIRFTVILLTPGDFDVAALPQPGGVLPGVPGCVVAGCHDRAMLIGGWRSIGKERGPLPQRPLLPPGSTWFMEGLPADAAAISGLSGTAIGERTEWGFGRVTVGRWKHIAEQGGPVS